MRPPKPRNAASESTLRGLNSWYITPRTILSSRRCQCGLKVKINSGQCGIKAAKFCFEAALFRISEAVQCGFEVA